MTKEKLENLLSDLLDIEGTIISLEYINETLITAHRLSGNEKEEKIVSFYKSQISGIKSDLMTCITSLDLELVNMG